jgi:hypothetical protein
VRPAPKADNLTLSVRRLSRKCEIINVSQPYGTPRPVTRTALLFFTSLIGLLFTQYNINNSFILPSVMKVNKPVCYLVGLITVYPACALSSRRLLDAVISVVVSFK